MPLGSESYEYPILSPQPGYAEQDPLEWRKALEMTCRKLKERLPEAFAGMAGVGICGQMHTQVYLDRTRPPPAPGDHLDGPALAADRRAHPAG